MTLIIYYSDANKATLRKISCALKAECLSGLGRRKQGGLVGYPTSPIFGRSVSTISTRGALALLLTPPIFSDLPTSLFALSWVQILAL